MSVVLLGSAVPLQGSEKKNSMARDLAFFTTSVGIKGTPSIANLLREDQMLQVSKGKTSFQRIDVWKVVPRVEVDHCFIQGYRTS